MILEARRSISRCSLVRPYRACASSASISQYLAVSLVAMVDVISDESTIKTLVQLCVVEVDAPNLFRRVACSDISSIAELSHHQMP